MLMLFVPAMTQSSSASSRLESHLYSLLPFSHLHSLTNPVQKSLLSYRTTKISPMEIVSDLRISGSMPPSFISPALSSVTYPLIPEWEVSLLLAALRPATRSLYSCLLFGFSQPAFFQVPLSPIMKCWYSSKVFVPPFLQLYTLSFMDLACLTRWCSWVHPPAFCWRLLKLWCVSRSFSWALTYT